MVAFKKAVEILVSDFSFGTSSAAVPQSTVFRDSAVSCVTPIAVVHSLPALVFLY